MPPRSQKVSEEIANTGVSVGMDVGYVIRYYLSYCLLLSPLFIFQAKAKGQSAKVNINSALVEDIISLDEVKEDMTAVLNALKDDLTRNLSIRTSPGISAHLFFSWTPSCVVCLPVSPYLNLCFSNFTEDKNNC